MNEIRPINWTGNRLELLDQTLLPHEHVTVRITDYRAAAAAITEMRVRGAPAIGVTAGYAMVLAAAELQSRERDPLHRRAAGGWSPHRRRPPDRGQPGLGGAPDAPRCRG